VKIKEWAKRLDREENEMDDRENTFKRVTLKNGQAVPNLYRSEYQTTTGEWIIKFVALFRDRLHKKPRRVVLGSDLNTAKKKLDDLMYKNRSSFDFDKEKREAVEAGKAAQEAVEIKTRTLEWWLPIARELPEMLTVRKGAHQGLPRREGTRDGDVSKHWHLTRHLGAKALCDLTQQDIDDYVEKRRNDTVIRWGKPTAFKVQPGTIGLELTALRFALDLARKHKDRYHLEVPELDFSGKPKAGNRERTLRPDELQRFFEACDGWFLDVATWANETSMARADIIRMRESWIDEQSGRIHVQGGRQKTSTKQTAPLTDACRDILARVRESRKRMKVQAIVNPAVFQRDDGSPLTGPMIQAGMRKACKKARINDGHERSDQFTFHGLRHQCVTRWHRERISPKTAMLSMGDKSSAMLDRYINISDDDVSREHGTAKKFYYSIETTQKALAEGNEK
jgi:integrase